MEVDDASASKDGFTGRYRGESKDRWTQLIFESPGIVRYRAEQLDHKGDLQSLIGAALHCVPKGRGQSRLLFRTYFKKAGIPLFLRFLLAVQPLWKRHLNSCKVLEQDVGLITSQEDAPFESLAAACLPLKSEDTFVVSYRKWLDRVAHGMPYAPVGWHTRGGQSGGSVALSDQTHRFRRSRLFNHVLISQTSRRALRNCVRLRNAALFGFVFTTAAASLCGTALVKKPLALASLLAALLAAAAAKVEKAFYRNFDRHPWRP
mmetsp:Transcript_26510/g.81534  ORF Transcript_26510/g.81534 Transcript_26510/m.81534 type:complete len:262 (+) Transcript_26510:173-958(+)